MRLKLWCALALVSVSAIQVGCTVSHTSQAPVEIPGPESTEKKVELARNIVRRVTDSGLNDRLLARFPELDRDELAGLEMRIDTIVDTTNSKRRSDPIVRIVCVFSYDGTSNSASQIVAACANEVTAALK